MKVSDDYVRQCEKAKEIQGLWNPDVGDWVYSYGNRSVEKVIGEVTMRYTKVWLPGQEDLQAILRYETPLVMLQTFNDWLYTDSGYGCVNGARFHSMQELWLAFVMWERFGKVWDGRDWKGV
jgi:hypothetical protein